MISQMEIGSETVTHVSLVDMGEANGVAKIIKVEVTKTDDSTEDSTDKSTVVAPDTGDVFSIENWLMVFVACACCLAMIILKGQKNKHTD